MPHNSYQHSRGSAHERFIPATPLRVPGMILLGSTGRNSGKTLFGTRLIELFAGHCTVVGLKVSTVRDPVPGYPRHRTDREDGGEPQSGFDLHEETDAGSKDTGRMIAAGADRVFWLRSRPEAQSEGIREVRRRIGAAPDTLIVCESNSLRSVVEPDLFLMLHPGSNDEETQGDHTPPSAGGPPPDGDDDGSSALTGRASARPGASAVWPHVDRHVVFTPEPRDNGRSTGLPSGRFDFPPDDIMVVDGQFSMRRPGTALLLAGGPSTRMGTDKRRLTVGKETMLVRTWKVLNRIYPNVILSANDVPSGFPDVAIVTDRFPGIGPIAGIEAGLAAAPADPVFVIACDIPRVDQALLAALYRALPGYDVAVPRRQDGRFETLFALYRRTVLADVRALIGKGERRIRSLFSEARVREIPVPDGTLPNLNTRGEYREFLSSYVDEPQS